MPFLRPLKFHVERFHLKQEMAWLGYKAGKTLVLPWSRRSGKTELICQIMIEDIEDHGRPCLYVAKTRDQARAIVWPKFEETLRGNDNWKIYESALEVFHRPSGAVVRIKGADKDADNMAGAGYRIIAADEYALWRNPDVVKRVLTPMLADYNGQMIFTSTKRGKNYFFKLHQKALLDPDKYFTNEATMFDNTFLTDDGRAKVLSEYEGKDDPLYRQEVLNEYVVFEGMVFALEQNSYTEKRWDQAELDHSWHWGGMDHGFSPDPTAHLRLAYNDRRGYYQIYSEYRHTKLLIKDHADSIKALERWPLIGHYSDIDPQLIAEYNAVGLNLTPAEKTSQEERKHARNLKVVNALRVGQLKIADNCKMLLDEMASYTWDQDHNDDLVDTLRYLWTNKQLPRKPTEVVTNQRKFTHFPGTNDGGFQQNFDD